VDLRTEPRKDASVAMVQWHLLQQEAPRNQIKSSWYRLDHQRDPLHPEEYSAPTWASALALQLYMDALTLHLNLLTLNLNLNHLIPLNHNSHLKKSHHVHAHHLEQVEE
jgi:hypothetical protein